MEQGEIQPLTEGLTLRSLQQALVGLMEVEAVRVLQGGERPAVEFVGKISGDGEAAFDQILERFTALGYTPLLTQQDGSQVLQAVPGVPDGKTGDPRVNLVLFVLTAASVLFVGSYAGEGKPFNWADGAAFAGTLLSILVVHEFSHYFVGRRYGSPLTLPYFIPLPLGGFGTMGAVILQRAPMRSRKTLFDIGVAGPLGGLIVALPLLIIGLLLSKVQPLPVSEPYTMEGNSLLYLLIKLAIFKQILPSNGIDVMLHPMAMAAWAGLLVTALNLFPIGQLDGGHVTYALWGRKAWTIARGMVFAALMWGALLLVLGNPAGFTWLVWGGLGWFMGPQHPAPLNDITPLDPKRRLLGWITVGIFFLVLVPIPLVNVVP
jgi:membrane-associated protease RseP (regulator of RpoE activity)